MNIDFSVRQVDDSRDLKLLRNFLHNHELGYPRYDEWVDCTCAPEIENGYKRGIIALHENKIVGDMIWQPHKELPRTTEGKNLRIHPGVRGRGLAYFLMRQCESESRAISDTLLVDVPGDQQDVKMFLLRYGFSVLYQAHLYDDKRLETIMVKKLH